MINYSSTSKNNTPGLSYVFLLKSFFCFREATLAFYVNKVQRSIEAIMYALAYNDNFISRKLQFVCLKLLISIRYFYNSNRIFLEQSYSFVKYIFAIPAIFTRLLCNFLCPEVNLLYLLAPNAISNIVIMALGSKVVWYKKLVTEIVTYVYPNYYGVSEALAYKFFNDDYIKIAWVYGGFARCDPLKALSRIMNNSASSRVNPLIPGALQNSYKYLDLLPYLYRANSIMGLLDFSVLYGNSLFWYKMGFSISLLYFNYFGCYQSSFKVLKLKMLEADVKNEKLRNGVEQKALSKTTSFSSYLVMVLELMTYYTLGFGLLYILSLNLTGLLINSPVFVTSIIIGLTSFFIFWGLDLINQTGYFLRLKSYFLKRSEVVTKNQFLCAQYDRISNKFKDFYNFNCVHFATMIFAIILVLIAHGWVLLGLKIFSYLAYKTILKWMPVDNKNLELSRRIFLSLWYDMGEQGYYFLQGFLIYLMFNYFFSYIRAYLDLKKKQHEVEEQKNNFLVNRKIEQPQKGLFSKIKDYYFSTTDLRKSFIVLFYYILASFMLRFLFYDLILNYFSGSDISTKPNTNGADTTRTFIVNGICRTPTSTQAYFNYAQVLTLNNVFLSLSLLFFGIIIRTITRYFTNLWISVLTKIRYGTEGSEIDEKVPLHIKMYKEISDVSIFATCMASFEFFTLGELPTWNGWTSFTQFLKSVGFNYIVLTMVYELAVLLFLLKK